jgi:CHAT domain-containing protein
VPADLLSTLPKLFQKTAGRARSRIWWCVTGELGFLPIHAAGKAGKERTGDYVVSSYVPTLAALMRTRSGWTPVARVDVTGLLVCEKLSGRDRLPHALEEVRAVQACFDAAQAQILNEPSAHISLTETRKLLVDTPAHVLHLASHAVQKNDPLQSAFVLQDGRLTIADIMDLRLPRAALAFLSAGETAKGDARAPDQAVHFAASMLCCGFRSVIATMW